MILWLSWVILGSAALMLGLAIWNFIDAQRDSQSAMADRRNAIRLQALGMLRRSWIWLVVSVFWIWYGVHVLDPTESSQHGRPLALFVIWLENVDIWTARWTRLQVTEAIMTDTNHKHQEVMAALTVNTVMTQEGVTAAREAYQAADKAAVVANDMNQKIEHLNARLLEQRK